MTGCILVYISFTAQYALHRVRRDQINFTQVLTAFAATVQAINIFVGGYGNNAQNYTRRITHRTAHVCDMCKSSTGVLYMLFRNISERNKLLSQRTPENSLIYYDPTIHIEPMAARRLHKKLIKSLDANATTISQVDLTQGIPIQIYCLFTSAILCQVVNNTSQQHEHLHQHHCHYHHPCQDHQMHHT